MVYFCAVLLSFIFSLNRNPHLIVGDYKCIDNVKVTSFLGKELILGQWYFSSDEFTSHVYLMKNDQESRLNLAYKIYENDEELVEEGFSDPVIVFKNPDRKNFILVFSIRELKKSGMILHYEENISQGDVQFMPADISMERIAGPPENMD